ncbi:hypothetical protein GTW52_28235 [Streptomyces sp. SID8358]|uniref:hypothetical protein n=1 Tax=Streptomyces sp. SID8358 TaxID=2690342 RepID=UPI000DAD7F72|nr:hypothetical protein [Streptomyces sp. SID8358]MYU36960.1 hypothetical protein [Streptomyces sp. SID8358]
MPVEQQRPAPAPGAHTTRAGKAAEPGADSLWFRKRVDTSHYASPSTYPPCGCGAAICPDRPEDATRREDENMRTVEYTHAHGGDGGDTLPGTPWPGPSTPPAPDGGPGVPNPPQE